MEGKGFFSDVPPVVKGVIAIAGLAAIAIIGYSVYKKVNSVINPTDSKKEVDAAKAEVKALEAKGEKRTLSDVQLKTLANQIQTALNGMTEDEAAVYRAFTSVKTNIDVLNLIAAYGTRQTGYWYWSYFTGTLPSSIAHYFDVAEVKALNDMLAKKGIKYRF